MSPAEALATMEVNGIFAQARKDGVPPDVPVAQDDVHKLMVLAFVRGMAVERENYSARSRGTTETEYGTAPW